MRRDRANDRHPDRLLKRGHRDYEGRSAAPLLVAPRLAKTIFPGLGYLQRSNQIGLSEPRQFLAGRLDHQLRPLKADFHFPPGAHAHLLGDRRRDSKGQAVAPLEDLLNRHLATPRRECIAKVYPSPTPRATRESAEVVVVCRTRLYRPTAFARLGLRRLPDQGLGRNPKAAMELPGHR